jgi:hypothetical protein
MCVDATTVLDEAAPVREDIIPRPGFSRRRFRGPARRRHRAAGAVMRPIRPAEAAPEDVRIADLDWVDGRRNRRVPARLYWPSPGAPAGPVPLIVFSHGLGQSRTGYSYLGRHWAANGYASLHVQHVGSDGSVWAGNPFEVLDRVNVAADEREAIARAADMSFALDGNPGQRQRFRLRSSTRRGLPPPAIPMEPTRP